MVGEPTTEQAKRIHKARYSSVPMVKLRGARYTLKRGAHGYPDSLMNVPDPPETLYVLGSLDALCDGLAVVGARKATPYGMSAAEKFAGLAAAKGVPIISGGALGCDSHAHRGALSVGGRTVAVLGGGCDMPYPARNVSLFQEIIDHLTDLFLVHLFPDHRETHTAKSEIFLDLIHPLLLFPRDSPAGI